MLGHPIAHSLSPTLHRAAYAELDLPWHYDSIDVAPADLAAFVDSLGPEWVGLSLTMPLKETVLPLLTDVDPEAAHVRAVNTVVFDGPERHGYNTDITGLRGIVDEVSAEGSGAPGERTATVIGAGATARSTVAALAGSSISTLIVSARRPEAAHELVELASTLGCSATRGAWPVGAAELSSDLVISTVPAAVMADSIGVASSAGVLVDVIYDPWPTPLASAWQRAGGRVVGGLELLVRQAVEQVVLMTGRRPDIERMRAAGEAALAARNNDL